MKALWSLGLFSLATSAFGALSPYYDSIVQIETVLNSYPLSDVTAGPISKIESIGCNSYLVVAGNCRANVVLEALPSNGPGPTTYQVKSISNIQCFTPGS